MVAASVNRWQQEALETSAQLASCEQQREESKVKEAQARRHAAEKDRQYRELAKQGGTKQAVALREELERVTKERDDLEKKLRRALPALDASKARENKLRDTVIEEEEAAAEHLKMAKSETAELSKARSYSQSLRRDLKSEISALNSEMQDAQWQKKNAQSELQKQQRQRCEDLQKNKTLTADRQSVKAEAEHLRARLQWAENALLRREDDSTPTNRGGARSSRSATPKNKAVASDAREIPMCMRKDPVDLGCSSYDTNFVAAGKEPGRVGASQLTSGVSEDEQRRGDLTSTNYHVGEVKSADPFSLQRGELAQPSLPYTSSDAGAKLFEMLDKAKERADQRRLLSGAAQEVRAKARALEVLLMDEGAAGVA